MNWEVFDWGRKKHQLAEKQKTIDQANNSLGDAENSVMIEVGETIATFNKRGRRCVQSTGQETARENMRVSIDKYK